MDRKWSQITPSLRIATPPFPRFLADFPSSRGGGWGTTTLVSMGVLFWNPPADTKIWRLGVVVVKFKGLKKTAKIGLPPFAQPNTGISEPLQLFRLERPLLGHAEVPCSPRVGPRMHCEYRLHLAPGLVQKQTRPQLAFPETSHLPR